MQCCLGRGPSLEPCGSRSQCCLHCLGSAQGLQVGRRSKATKGSGLWEKLCVAVLGVCWSHKPRNRLGQLPRMSAALRLDCSPEQSMLQKAAPSGIWCPAVPVAWPTWTVKPTAKLGIDLVQEPAAHQKPLTAEQSRPPPVACCSRRPPAA